jgi:hypothetical protein
MESLYGRKPELNVASKMRVLPNMDATVLAISPLRGIASLSLNNKKLLLFDLEGQDDQNCE